MQSWPLQQPTTGYNMYHYHLCLFSLLDQFLWDVAAFPSLSSYFGGYSVIITYSIKSMVRDTKMKPAL